MVLIIYALDCLPQAQKMGFQSKFAEIFIERATKHLIVIECNMVNSYKLTNDDVKYLGTCCVPYYVESLLLLIPRVESVLLRQGLRFTPKDLYT